MPTVVDLGCEDFNVTTQLFTLDGTSVGQRQLALRAIDRVVKGRGKNSKAGKKALSLKSTVMANYVSAWGHVWEVPAVFSKCTNAQFCVSVSHESAISAFNKDSLAQLDLTKQIVALMTPSMQRRKENKNLLKDADKLHQENLATSAGIPVSSSSCTPPK